MTLSQPENHQPSRVDEITDRVLTEVLSYTTGAENNPNERALMRNRIIMPMVETAILSNLGTTDDEVFEAVASIIFKGLWMKYERKHHSEPKQLQ